MARHASSRRSRTHKRAMAPLRSRTHSCGNGVSHQASRRQLALDGSASRTRVELRWLNPRMGRNEHRSPAETQREERQLAAMSTSRCIVIKDGRRHHRWTRGRRFFWLHGSERRQSVTSHRHSYSTRTSILAASVGGSIDITKQCADAKTVH